MLVAFSLTPLGGTDSVSEAVAACVRIVRASGLPCETNAMFTTIEGEWEEVMGVIHACVERLAQDAPRVSMTLKMDHRPGVSNQLEQKVASVERHLGSTEGS